MKHRLIGVLTLALSAGLAYICLHAAAVWSHRVPGEQGISAFWIYLSGLGLPLIVVSGLGHLIWGQRFETMLQGEPSPESDQESWATKLTPIGRKIVIGSLLLGAVLCAGLVLLSLSFIAAG